MENIVNGIHDLHEKSVIEKSNINGIKEIIKYKYPVQPSIGKEGADIYGKVLSKVNSMWGEGELSDMKIRSKSRQGSPCSRTIGRQNRQDSIYLEDFKKMRTLTLNVEKTRIESDCTNKTTNLVSKQALQSQRNKTTDRYSLGQGQGQGGQNDMMEILSARQVQPGIFDRLNTARGVKEQSNNNNFDLFSK